ncbi:hypothetical protein [Salinimicrobium sp. TH3]|uniref:hypothetical protein n=1 Tax=Salinimicrobium sp. TH3 TaxID=2997342 RepID=UPI002273D998|nr:hypothetical protein [Salinimicrobium sp. TH3]MCY2685974.1 hypothetical protein [Salinimicrobium sp. TH3]
MKTTVVLRKFLAVGLSGILLSCNVYQKTPVSLESALQTKNHVKVTTIEKKEYEFQYLEKNNDQLLGATKKRSRTANLLKKEPIVKEGRIWKFELNEDNLQFIYYRNEFQTNMVKIGVPVFLTGLLVFAFIEGTDDWGWGSLDSTDGTAE